MGGVRAGKVVASGRTGARRNLTVGGNVFSGGVDESPGRRNPWNLIIADSVDWKVGPGGKVKAHKKRNH